MAKTFTHRVRLHFRSLSLTNTPFSTLLKNTETVYGQYGIKIEFSSGLSLGLSKVQAKKFEQIDGSCQWTIKSGEYHDLQKLGTGVPANEILVFYVQKFGQASLLGCGGHIPGKPACIVAALGSRWDTAHEIGHVLLGSSFHPVHSTDTNNLMFKFSSNATKTRVLTNAQLTRMKKSPCCVAL